MNSTTNQHQIKFRAKDQEQHNIVPPNEYDIDWMRDTWGWDTPEEYIRTQGRNLRPRIQAAIKLAQLKPGMRILDVGSGRGEIVLHCARMGIHAIGVDYSKDAVQLAEKAKATHSSKEQDFMHFICNNINNVKLDEKVDRIFLLDLIEHMHNWELKKLLKICRKLLASNGVIIIHTLPNKWVYDITYTYLLRFFRPGLPIDPRSEKEKAIHINEMTIRSLDKLLTSSNYQCRIWLQDLIIEQAKWHSKQPLSDIRGKIYPLLTNSLIGSLYKMLAKTPLRLLLVNEIFAVAWKPNTPVPIQVPSALTERLIIQLTH